MPPLTTIPSKASDKFLFRWAKTQVKFHIFYEYAFDDIFTKTICVRKKFYEEIISEVFRMFKVARERFEL